MSQIPLLSVKKIFTFLLIIALYYVFARLGLLLATINNNASPVWPATGFAIGIILVYGLWTWPAIFLGALLANLHTGSPLPAIAMISLGNAGEAIAAYIIYNRLQNHTKMLGHFAKIVHVIILSGLPTMVSACVGAFALYATHTIPLSSTPETWFTWWVGDAMGALILVPAILSFKENSTKPWFEFSLKHIISLSSLIILISAVMSLVIFASNGAGYIFLLLPCLLVAAIGCGIRCCYITSIVLCILGVGATSKGIGPFVDGSLNDNLIRFQLFLLVVCVTTITIEYLRKSGSMRWPSMALLGGWLFSGMAFYSFSISGKKADIQKFNNLTRMAEVSINEVLGQYTRVLESGAALHLSSKEVTRDEWKEFISNIRLKERFPGLRGLGVVKYVPTSALKKYTNQIRSTGLSHFNIHPLKKFSFHERMHSQDDHYIIQYIEPYEGNEKALGLDLSTEANRVTAAERARDNGTAEITDTISLVQDTQIKPAFLIFVPIYKKNASLKNTQERRNALVGFIYSPVISEDFFKAALKDYANELEMVAFSSYKMDREKIVFTNEKNISNFIFEKKTPMILAGNDFYIGWNRSKNFVTSTDTIASWVGLCGGVISLFLAIIISVLQRTSLEASHTAEKKTKELQDVQMTLINSARLSSLGQMAGGVAHEINNPLAIILGRASQLERYVKSQNMDQEKILSISRSIISTVERITRIIKSLRTISRDGTNDPYQDTALKNIIDNTLELCTEKFKNHEIQIIVKDLPQVKILCSETQISQVLINLINNSYDAVEHLKEKWIEISFVETYKSILILVKDSGQGIPPHIAEKLMEPFFTTKELGKGTGLGLSISKAIIEDHGGSLELDKACPHTCFVIHLPKSQAQQQAA